MCNKIFLDNLICFKNSSIDNGIEDFIGKGNVLYVIIFEYDNGLIYTTFYFTKR